MHECVEVLCLLTIWIRICVCCLFIFCSTYCKHGWLCKHNTHTLLVTQWEIPFCLVNDLPLFLLPLRDDPPPPLLLSLPALALLFPVLLLNSTLLFTSSFSLSLLQSASGLCWPMPPFPTSIFLPHTLPPSRDQFVLLSLYWTQGFSFLLFFFLLDGIGTQSRVIHMN